MQSRPLRVIASCSRFCRAALTLSVLTLSTCVAGAQQPAPARDITVPRGQVRSIDFSTSEGTWMSVDLSPDGRWVVFDLLAHIYRVPVAGGEAENLTENSGMAINLQPRYSPDGRSIAFISDRKGQNNLWIMDADGKNPRPVFVDKNVRVWEPTWTPDGQYIIVRRQQLGEDRDYAESIWKYNRGGGEGVELLGKDVHAYWPSVAPDGTSVYFHAAVCLGFPTSPIVDLPQGCFQLRQLDLTTGEVYSITGGRDMQQYRATSGGAIAPEISPDGRSLAFARRIPDGTISFKGHQFGPRNALWIRNLDNGIERLLMDPIETDIAEQFPELPRPLPGYSWARDGKSILISQGGKIRRVWIDTGKVDTIPFTARVHRTISEMAYAPFRITDEPFQVRFFRWDAASADGRHLAFQALGKIWLTDLPGGVPHRLTPSSFSPSEFSPAWSPDGRWIAFVTWDNENRGQLWKVAASGGTPQQLTQEAGEYFNPTWTADGTGLIVARGAGVTSQGRSLLATPWYEFVQVPSAGGPPTFIVRLQAKKELVGRPLPRVSVGPDGRLFYLEGKSDPSKPGADAQNLLLSVRPDGSDKRTYAELPNAEDVAISPDGRFLAFEQGSNVYVTPLPSRTGASLPKIDKDGGPFPVEALSNEGGLYPHWRDAQTLEFGSANRYFTYNTQKRHVESVEVKLTASRDLPTGTLALTNVRIVTPDSGKVIEKGTIVIKSGRIACVGSCETADAKVLDLTGKTVIPGWIDVHAHHHREHEGILPTRDFEQAIYMAYGVTTTRDPATNSQNVFPDAEMIEAGIVLGPRTFSTGEPLFYGNGPRWNDITSPEAAEHEVNRLADWGATAIKQYLVPRREQHQWIVDAARKRGLMVTAEGEDLFYDLGMIMDGQTGWEHPLLYLPLYGDVAKFFGQAHATYSVTDIVGSTASPYNEEYFLQSTDLWKDEKQRQWMPWRELVPHARHRMLRPITDYDFPLTAQGLADVIAEGGYGAMGGHGQEHGLGSHWEVWMYASAMGPMKALDVASLGGAHFIGIDKDVGSITVGKLADLMVLNSNPLDDIHNTLDMLYVLKAGRVYKADTLDEVWPAQKPFGNHYWVDPNSLKSDDRPVNYWDTPK